MPAWSGPVAARRMVVYGVTGSGKSSAANLLGALTGIPVHHVDDLTWEPGWVSVPDEEQGRRISRIVAGPAWILDSAYASWRPLVWDRVELVVALDYPRWLSLGRLLRRSVRRIVSHELACNGNHESWARLLGADSIVRWHFRSFARKRDRMRAWEAQPDGPPVARFARPRELQQWLVRTEAEPLRDLDSG